MKKEGAQRLSRLLSLQEASIYLGISITYLKGYVRTGIVEPIRLPHPTKQGFLERILFDIERLDEFIDVCWEDQRAQYPKSGRGTRARFDKLTVDKSKLG